MAPTVTPLVTIVVPVFEAQAYLARCLDSLVAQTYRSLEILLIDDGSTDASLSICQSYADRDSRIKTVSLPNGGVSRVRNRGILGATGEFIAFVDSDDAISPHMYANLVACQQQYDADVVCCGYKQGNKKFAVSEQDIFWKGECPIELIHSLEFSKNYGVVWNKLYRKSLIDDNAVQFPEGISFGEDMCFNVRYFKYVKRACLTKNCDYFYNPDNTSSLTRSPVSLKDSAYRFEQVVPLLIALDHNRNSPHCAEILARDFKFTSVYIFNLHRIADGAARRRAWQAVQGFYRNHKVTKGFVKPRLALLHYAVKNFPVAVLDVLFTCYFRLKDRHASPVFVQGILGYFLI